MDAELKELWEEAADKRRLTGQYPHNLRMHDRYYSGNSYAYPNAMANAKDDLSDLAKAWASQKDMPYEKACRDVALFQLHRKSCDITPFREHFFNERLMYRNDVVFDFAMATALDGGRDASRFYELFTTFIRDTAAGICDADGTRAAEVHDAFQMVMAPDEPISMEGLSRIARRVTCSKAAVFMYGTRENAGEALIDRVDKFTALLEEKPRVVEDERASKLHRRTSKNDAIVEKEAYPEPDRAVWNACLRALQNLEREVAKPRSLRI